MSTHGSIPQVLAKEKRTEELVNLVTELRPIFQSIANRDLIVVRNCVLLLAAMVVVINFIVDVLYAAIDQRIEASDL